MRTTVTLDDQLLAKAEQLCGHLERSALLKEALGALAAVQISFEDGTSVLRTEPGLGRVALPMQVATSAEKACKLFKP
ncbi:MAG: type II toxin-antitoxin system VapB family antitoxin [Cyanobacteria bacterium]|nr:type II toxin-antitoxin system VapB family antitoxin [Cyanobacteriota bacterium]